MHANSGSCSNVMNYLEHEDLDRAMQGGYRTIFQSPMNKWEVLKSLRKWISKQRHKEEAGIFCYNCFAKFRRIEENGKDTEETCQALKDYIKMIFRSNTLKKFQ
jgi:hypothetical protein